jgi:hypothetical protein
MASVDEGQARPAGQAKAMKRWWVRWLDGSGGQFEYHGPWWVSGEAFRGDETKTIFVAAVVAENEAAAKRVIEMSQDAPGPLEWSFVNERADDWSPFCDRFPSADWMQWPWPAFPTAASPAAKESAEPPDSSIEKERRR